MTLGLLGVSAVLPQTSLAAPALSITQEYQQPSGETFKAAQHGDEWFHWITTQSGDVIVLGEDGYWHYAQLKSQELKQLPQRVAIDDKPDTAIDQSDISRQSSSIVKAKKSLQLKTNQKSSQLKSIQSVTDTESDESIFEHNNPEKLLVVLAEFKDTPLRYTDSAWNSVFFGSSNSVNDFYKENSEGKFYFTPAAEQSGRSNDGVIRVKLPYYHPNTDNEQVGQAMERDVLTLASKYIDYSKFDTNKDGFISAKELHLTTILAGYERSYDPKKSPAVWGHNTVLVNPVKLDGVYLGDYRVGGYTQFGEVHGSVKYNDDHMATIGIMAHELGHDLGLPDLYDTDTTGETSLGVGIHSLMGSGSWGTADGEPGSSPVHLDALSKAIFGFVDPTVVTKSGTYTLKSQGTHQYNVLKVPTADPNQYFLLENREFEGYDKALHDQVNSGGIAIWHVDESVFAEDYYGANRDENHKGLDLEEANEGLLGYSQLDTEDMENPYDHYFNSFISTFGANTTPNSDLYDGEKTNITITSSQASNNSMKVTVELPETIKRLALSDKDLTMVVGEKKTITALATYADADGTVEDVSNVADWTKSASSIDLDHGVITALKPGRVKVQASYLGKTASLYVQVNSANTTTLTSLVPSSTEISLQKGKTQKITLQANYSNGTTKDVTTRAKWSTSDSKIASVISGRIYTRSVGTATITGSYEGQVATITVTVQQGEKILTSLTIDNQSVTLKPSETTQLVVTATYDDKSTEDITAKAEWTSSNTKVATVDQGVIRAIAPGTTTILASYGGKSIQTSVNVADSQKVTSLVADKKRVSLKVGAQEQPTITAKYEDGSKADVTADVEWSVTNKSLVSVKDGLLVGLAPGKTSVQAKLGDRVVRIYITVEEA